MSINISSAQSSFGTRRHFHLGRFVVADSVTPPPYKFLLILSLELTILQVCRTRTNPSPMSAQSQYRYPLHPPFTRHRVIPIQWCPSLIRQLFSFLQHDLYTLNVRQSLVSAAYVPVFLIHSYIVFVSLTCCIVSRSWGYRVHPPNGDLYFCRSHHSPEW